MSRILLHCADSLCRSASLSAARTVTTWIAVRWCWRRKCSPRFQTRWCRTWRNTAWNRILRATTTSVGLARPSRHQNLHSSSNVVPRAQMMSILWCISSKARFCVSVAFCTYLYFMHRSKVSDANECRQLSTYYITCGCKEVGNFLCSLVARSYVLEWTS